jgi:hypothetical protein
MTDHTSSLHNYCARCQHPLSDADTCTIRFPHCMGKPLHIPQVVEAMGAECVLEEDLAAFAWALRDEVVRLQAENAQFRADRERLAADLKLANARVIAAGTLIDVLYQRIDKLKEATRVQPDPDGGLREGGR